MKNDPLNTIKKLIKERYSEAKVVFWGGSIAKAEISKNSDLDLVIIYEQLPDAYREAFVYDNWPIDAFVNDIKSLNYLFNQAKKTSLILGLPAMVAEGIEVTEKSLLGNQLREQALTLLQSEPSVSVDQLKLRRFKITDLLDDLKEPKNKHEQLAIIFEVYKQLAEFYLLANKKWIGSGKQLPRLLKKYNSEIAEEFYIAFSDISDIAKVSTFAEKILAPHGGLIWDGFRLDSNYKSK